MGKQDLRGEHAVAGKVLFITLGQTILANGSGRLKLMYSAGAHLPTQPHHARRHRARRDQHYLYPLLMQGGNLINPAANSGFVQATAIVSE